MKVFTVQDYLKLTPEGQAKVGEWLGKYGFEDVIMVTSQAILEQDVSDGEAVVYENDHVAVYADITVKRYLTETEFIYVSNSDTSPNAYTKIAELFFDDFPWDVLSPQGV